MPLLKHFNQNKINVNHLRLGSLMKTAYAERIRNLRERLNLSQESLAELTDISQNQISRYERGINDPTGDALVALVASLYNLIASMFGGGLTVKLGRVKPDDSPQPLESSPRPTK